MSFNELYDTIKTEMAKEEEKPQTPDNRTETKGGGNNEQPAPPPNQRITEGGEK